MKTMHKQGFTYAAIGVRLNRTEFSITRHLSKIQTDGENALRMFSKQERETISNRVYRLKVFAGSYNELARISNLHPILLKALVKCERMAINQTNYKKLVEAWQMYKSYGI